MTATTPFGFSWCAGVLGRVPPEYRAALSALAKSTSMGDGGTALVGSWTPGEVTTSAAGPHRAAFLGTCRFSGRTAATELEHAVTRRRIDGLARLPGSFHLVVFTPDAVWLVPDRTGLRRFWYVRVGGGLLFASHAVLLASLVGALVDEAWLATRLAAPSLRGAVEERSPFAGVAGVPPGSFLRVGIDGSTQTDRWWSPPEPVVALPVAGAKLKESLESAVGHRVRAVAHASVDLSGGLDSTALAFLAATSAPAAGSSLTTLTRTPASPANDDPIWAAQARTALRGVEHLDLAGDEALPFGRLGVPAPLDEPDPSAMLAGAMQLQANVLGARGSKLHLAGNGGDQVLGAPMAYLAGLARRHPLLAARHLRGHRALVGLSGKTFAELLRPGRYADWLALAAAQLGGRPGEVPQTWAALPHAPSGLIGADVLAVAASVLRDVAERSEQVGDIERYGAMVRLRHTAAVHRLHRDAAALQGLRLELPFLDADVAEVCLSTRLHERVDPYRAKPLLVEAMRGTVPDCLLTRTTMGVYDTELHIGWRRHRAEVRSLLDGAALAERGLVREAGIARLVEGAVTTEDLFWLNEVLAAELWLRSLAAVAPLVRSSPVSLHSNDAGSN